MFGLLKSVFKPFYVFSTYGCIALNGMPRQIKNGYSNFFPPMTEYMKPDTETYNWVIQAYTRAESYDRLISEVHQYLASSLCKLHYFKLSLSNSYEFI